MERKPIIVLDTKKIEKNITNKIAVIYPSKVVGKYAKSTIGTISAYLLFYNKQFVIETFDTSDENEKNILSKLDSLKNRGFKNVIALFTEEGFDTFNSSKDINDLNIYFPLINKSEIFTENNNFIFGGISNQEQIDLLYTLSSENTTMFYVDSYLGNKLRDAYFNKFNIGIVKKIEKNNNRFESIMKNKQMIGSTILLNTPIIKSSIIMSQLTAYEVMPSKILSTQINFNPLLLKLTQHKDRRSFYVVSAISKVDNFIEEYTQLLGSDIVYNWVDYSSLIGVNYLIDNKKLKVTKAQVIDNQVEYEQTLYRSTFYGFQKVLTN